MSGPLSIEPNLGGDAPALETERLGKRYGKVRALHDCWLSLPAGAVIALVGPNGAGKSTLLQLVTALLEPTEGVVRVFDAPVRAGAAAGLEQVAFVAQDHPLYRGFTLADHLEMGRRLNRRWDRTLAERRFAELDLPLRRRAKDLSGGQQAQVALALALAKRAPLLVLDEPLASLDPLARREFMSTVMAAVAEDGLTVLMSSHVVAELERVSDWLVVLSHGRVRLSGPVDDLVSSHRVLTGPRTELAASVPGVVRQEHADRHSTMLVRTTGERPEFHPAWQSRSIGLEDLVLAYLELPDPASQPPAQPSPTETSPR
ncbi:ABC transporter ATP-binding protein [Embleya scabrispora]|uniref:ABC transporter ATP-binding protein n=1 Tax=Embleya scabrispora TaxID=159449 RepID=UPI000368AD9C|nr:ABC transporter ATP-binding protein [Embleya scabrispora]